MTIQQESPEYVRISLAAAMTLGLVNGAFFRGATLYCVNLLLTYSNGCVGRCAYCGLSRSRKLEKIWTDYSFIRVDWPTVSLNEVLERMDSCPYVERVCVSMVTNRRAPEDCLTIVRRLRKKTDSISGLITPTIIDRSWLEELKRAGADKVGIAIDAATPELFDKLRGKGVGGPHRWEKYWNTVEEAVDVFGRYNVGVHLIVGLGETEEEMVRCIQTAYDIGALTHLFSFFPEEGSIMEEHTQPPIGQYRRIQLARYLINKGLTSADNMRFDNFGRLIDFGLEKDVLDEVIESGLPFMTSGCASKKRDNACNRPFSDYTPYHALIGEMRNYPFVPTKDDIKLIRRQLQDYSNIPVKVWVDGLECLFGYAEHI
ncbi:MAG: radical SAM protein [Nitrososphaerota archaeon]